ncbi:MAG: hypothetical protein ACR2GD_05370 [Pyrinomonadaceae bacterium]
MKKQNNQNWQTLFLATIAAIILLAASVSAFAQSKENKDILSLLTLDQDLRLNNYNGQIRFDKNSIKQ